MSGYDRSGKSLQEANQVDIRYRTASVLVISQKTERNIIKSVELSGIERDQLCNLPSDTRSIGHVKLLGVR